MEGDVTMKYSVDGGVNWSTATTVKINRGHAWIRPEDQDGQPDKTMGTNSLCAKKISRLIVALELDINQFNSNINAAADTLYVFVNKLRAAPLVHLYYSGTSIDGFTSFATNPNTNYLVPIDTPDVEFETTDGTKLRKINFTLGLQAEYSITP